MIQTGYLCIEHIQDTAYSISRIVGPQYKNKYVVLWVRIPESLPTKVVNCVVLCIVCVSMCTVLLPPAVNSIAVNKCININNCSNIWSRWPRGLKRRSADACFLGLRVRIPPWSWMTVSCEIRVLSRRNLRDGLITLPGVLQSAYLRHWAWSGSTITVFTFTDQVWREEVGRKKKMF